MNKIKLKIGILFGGQSHEHSISIMSALNILNSINNDAFEIFPYAISNQNEWLTLNETNKVISTIQNIDNPLNFKISSIKPHRIMDAEEIQTRFSELDIVFPCIHGAFGEDGRIQKYLEGINVRYVGSNSDVSLKCYDKTITKNIFRELNIPQASYDAYDINEFINYKDEIMDKFKFPCFIKPARGGSSIGVRKAMNFDQIVSAADEIKELDSTIIIEEEIIGQEIECAVIGNSELSFAPLGEIKNNNGFYNFENKYRNNSASLIIPAQISKSATKRIYDYAKKVYLNIGISDLARIDFFYIKKNEIIYINEINTMPGFTKKSLFPLVWDNKGVEFQILITRLIKEAIARGNLV
jgi:D-alanine-D-alanine ligase